MATKQEVTQADTQSWIKRNVWKALGAPASITAAVYFWINQLPPQQRYEMWQAIYKFLQLPH